jgi:hypothetical protein
VYILNKQSQTANKGWFSSWILGGRIQPLTIKDGMLQSISTGPQAWMDSVAQDNVQ